MRDWRVLYPPTNPMVNFPIVSLPQLLLSIPGIGSKWREEYAKKYWGNTQWMRCAELKMKDKKMINPFGNLVTACVIVLWKSEGKHAKQKFYPGQSDCKPLFINVSSKFCHNLSPCLCYFSWLFKNLKCLWNPASKN